MKSFMNQLRWTGVVLISVLVWQCSEPNNYSDPTDNTPPGQVNNVQVTNLNGGAIIEFTRPSDPNLMGVKAIYKLNEDGALMERWASAFSDTIILEGYGNTDQHLVELYAVKEGGAMSAPVQVIVQPLTPPVFLIRETLKTQTAFGGIYVGWKNEFEKPMHVTLYTYTEDGDSVVFDRYFSKSPEDYTVFRRFAAEEQRFCIEVGDRWLNYAPPLDTLITPLHEIEIKGRNELNEIMWKLHHDAINRGDVTRISRPFTELFDKNYTNYFYNNLGSRPDKLPDYIPESTNDDDLFPQYLTIDMGRSASYSRFKQWIRNRNPWYSAWVWYEYEIWGSNYIKPASEIGDGSRLDNLRYWTEWKQIDGADRWKEEGWERLMKCVVTLPSGTPNTVQAVTAPEDIAYCQNGFEFEVDPDMTSKSFRYIRIVLQKQTHSNPTYIMWAEMEFYGAYTD